MACNPSGAPTAQRLRVPENTGEHFEIKKLSASWNIGNCFLQHLATRVPRADCTPLYLVGHVTFD